MEVSPTGYVILGMLRHEARSGYEIKQIVDHSTRFFWAASYSQIYPELRRLAKAGLVTGTEQPRGGRKRTVYELTEAGRGELRRWLDEDPQTFEVRDEALLKLFFASEAEEGRTEEILAAKQRGAEEKLSQLRAIEPFVSQLSDPHPYRVLRFGLESAEWTIDWCRRERDALAGAEQDAREEAA